MAEAALAKAIEVAARLSGGLGFAASSLGKRSGDSLGGPGLGMKQQKKIYVPVKDHPQINFLGLLIGPKGATQKHLQEMSGARIIIRGKGSSRDGGTSSTGTPEDDEELHVSLEGSEEQIARASAEIQKLFDDPAAAGRLKAQQLANLGNGLSGDVYGPSGSSGTASGSGSAYQVELRVPNSMVGLIIGKGGENVLRIQLQLNCIVQIQKESEMQPGETQRQILIKGDEPNVKDAKKRIDEIIAAQIVRQSSGGRGDGGGGGNSERGAADKMRQELDSAFLVKLPVPNDKVGIIIGKGGMNIKAIQERSRCTIQIPSGPDENDPNVRTLTIGADTKESCDAAQIEIFNTLNNQQQQQMNAYNSITAGIIVTVPDDKVGLIIGKGGATVKDIQARHGVKLQIPSTTEPGVIPLVRNISIAGDERGMAAAKYEVEMICQGLSVNRAQQQQPQGMYAQAQGMYAQPQGMYGQPQGMYGQPQIDPYGMNPYGMQMQAMDPMYQMMMMQQAAMYGMQQQQQPAPPAAQAAPAPAEEVPTDPTHFYGDYWHYAQYYGEVAARAYYQAWSPPEGTPPPPGITPGVPPTGDAVAAVAVAAAAASSSSSAEYPYAEKEAAPPGNGNGNGNGNGSVNGAHAAAVEESDPATAAWDEYRSNYKTWWLEHGQASGAPEEPPSM